MDVKGKVLDRVAVWRSEREEGVKGNDRRVFCAFQDGFVVAGTGAVTKLRLVTLTA
jgi:hypothetical protein